MVGRSTKNLLVEAQRNMARSEKLTCAAIIERINAATQKLSEGVDGELRGFVADADAANVLLAEMNAGLDAVDQEMDMLDSDSPPPGAEKYVEPLEKELEDEN